MSYSACSNSALLQPEDYPYGAVGSVIVPTLLYTSTASNAAYTYFNPITLPKGVWQISGTVRLDAQSAGATMNSGIIQFLYDNVNVSRNGLNVPGGVEWMMATGVVVSNGTDQLTCVGTGITTTGNYILEQGDNSIIYLVRIA